MSELTPCNYCTWQGMKRDGYRKATLAERRALWDRDGKEPYSGSGVVIVNKAGEFAAWFMELPASCCC